MANAYRVQGARGRMIASETGRGKITEPHGDCKDRLLLPSQEEEPRGREGRSAGDEKWLGSGSILKLEPLGFPELGVWCERQTAVKEGPIFGPSTLGG